MNIIARQTPLFHLLSIAHRVEVLASFFKHDDIFYSSLGYYRLEVRAWVGPVTMFRKGDAFAGESIGVI